MGDYGDHGTESGDMEGTDVVVVDGEGGWCCQMLFVCCGCGGVEAQEEGGDGRFAGAGSADEGGVAVWVNG